MTCNYSLTEKTLLTHKLLENESAVRRVRGRKNILESTSTGWESAKADSGTTQEDQWQRQTQDIEELGKQVSSVSRLTESIYEQVTDSALYVAPTPEDCY